MDTRKVGQEAAGKVLEQVRKSQETVTGALKTAASVAQFVTPPLPPSVSSRLPSRDDLTTNAHNLAGQLQDAQRRAGERIAAQRKAAASQASTAQRRAGELIDPTLKAAADRASTAQRRAGELLDPALKVAADRASTAQRRASELLDPVLRIAVSGAGHAQRQIGHLLDTQRHAAAGRASTAQQRVSELLTAQRQFTAQAMDMVTPLLDRAGVPAEVTKRFSGRRDLPGRSRPRDGRQPRRGHAGQPVGDG